jgi:hypothetical protein
LATSCELSKHHTKYLVFLETEWYVLTSSFELPNATQSTHCFSVPRHNLEAIETKPCFEEDLLNLYRRLTLFLIGGRKFYFSKQFVKQVSQLMIKFQVPAVLSFPILSP